MQGNITSPGNNSTFTGEKPLVLTLVSDSGHQAVSYTHLHLPKIFYGRVMF